MRTGISNSPEHEICLHHEQAVLARYSQYQRNCCNPFGKHQKPIKGSLQEVSLNIAEDFNSINISVTPGKKICPTCCKELTTKLQAASNKKDQQFVDESDPHVGNESDGETVSSGSNEEIILRHDLDTSLEEMDLSPMKLHGVASHSKVTLGKRKLQQFHDKLKNQETTLQKRVARVIDVMPEDLELRELST